MRVGRSPTPPGQHGRWSSSGGAKGLLGSAAEVGEVETGVDDDLRGETVTLADQAEQDVLSTDVVVLEPQRFPQRQLQHLLRPAGEADAAAGGRRRPQPPPVQPPPSYP